MADEDKKQHLEKEESPDQGQPDVQQDKPEEKEVWKELAEEAGLNVDEVKSRDDFIKIYKDSRKGLSEQGEKLKEYEQGIQRIAPILQAINNDPELYKKVQAALGGEEPKADKDTETSPHDPRLDDLVSDKQSEVVSLVEREFGIPELKDEEARKAREIVGNKLKFWGYSNQNLPPVSKLKEIMEDAYKAAGYQKATQESSSSASVGFGTPRSAIISPESITADTLSPEEKQAAERMGISYADYAKNKREIYS